jgi:hypothetical protein
MLINCWSTSSSLRSEFGKGATFELPLLRSYAAHLFSGLGLGGLHTPMLAKLWTAVSCLLDVDSQGDGVADQADDIEAGDVDSDTSEELRTSIIRRSHSAGVRAPDSQPHLVGHSSPCGPLYRPICQGYVVQSFPTCCSTAIPRRMS